MPTTSVNTHIPPPDFQTFLRPCFALARSTTRMSIYTANQAMHRAVNYINCYIYTITYYMNYELFALCHLEISHHGLPKPGKIQIYTENEFTKYHTTKP